MQLVRNTEILNYLIAKTPESLRESMLRNNLEKGRKFSYQDVQYVVEEKKAYWICWYYEDIASDLEAKVNEVKK